MEQTMKIGTLSALEAGSRFTYGGVEWVVLEHRPRAALCIAADVLEQRAFDEDNKNDFAASSLRAYLNGEFLNKLVEAGADEAAFFPIVMNLTSDDGLEDYGKDTAKIGLISCAMYRAFREIIPPASDWWWTCTPWTTARNGNSCNVRYVYTSGALHYDNAFNGYYGVRPLCYLKSDIPVSFNEADTKERKPSPMGDMLDALMHGLFGRGNVEAFAQAADETEDDDGECDFGGLAGTIRNMYEAFTEKGFTDAQAWELTYHFVRCNDFSGGGSK